MNFRKKSTLAILGGKPVCGLKEPHYSWPIITQNSQKAVLKQLRTSVSIYNKSGIFDDFEKVFGKYHKRSHSLLCNSGTNAILSMYLAIGLKKDDEIICPAYTFFATVSPVFFTGATPILADCDINGNLDPDCVKKLISPRTKAVIVTHMWGIPAQIEKLVTICKKHKILLLEDCSHAHGALYKGKIVGSWGDMAAWSLQGQKTITGGEGGILVTNNSDFYYRALLLGHYNKRCLQEIPKNHPLHKFSVTGMGLKLRAHPLAIALAYEQLSHLKPWLKQRQIYADRFINTIKKYAPEGLLTPLINKGSYPTWYGLVLRYNPSYFKGLSVEKFVAALHAEGLKEFDIPKSTMPLNYLPLFQDPSILFPSYKGLNFYKSGQFPNAESFYSKAFKLPIWVRKSDKKIVDLYIKGLVKVIKNYKDLL